MSTSPAPQARLTAKRAWIAGGAVVAIVVVIIVVANAGGGGSKNAAPPPPPPPPSAPVYPLTGLPVTDQATVNRAALVVKIDNADGATPEFQARPPSGINQADVVYEEMVEGSTTRLAAVFHSMNADPVGPVRSARSTDVAVFSPLDHPLFAWSGANPDFTTLIRSSPIVDVGVEAHPDVYSRRGDRLAPHNLYSATPALYSLSPPDARPPPALFPYRAEFQGLPVSAQSVGSVHVDFGSGPGSAPVDWTWHPDANGFARDQKGSPHVDENNEQVVVPNVIVQNVDYTFSGGDVAGNPIPEAQLVGTGSCWVLTAGSLIPCHWNKTAPDAVTTYTDDATNQPIPLTPGRTWVELVPTGGASKTG